MNKISLVVVEPAKSRLRATGFSGQTRRASGSSVKLLQSAEARHVSELPGFAHRPHARFACTQAVAPDELDLETAVDLLAKRAAKDSAKAAKAAQSGGVAAEGAPTSGAKPATKKPQKVSVRKAAPAAAGKAAGGKAAAKSAAGGKRAAAGALAGSANGKLGRRRAAPGSNGSDSRSSSKTASSSAKAAAESGSTTSGGGKQKAGAAAADAARKPPSAYQAFRKARWDDAKARHTDLTGKEVRAECQTNLTCLTGMLCCAARQQL